MWTLLMVCAVNAWADPETFVTVSCDQATGELRIEERHEDKDVSYPIVIGPKDMEFAVSGLVLAKEVSGGIAWEDRPISRECRLETNVYVATFRAHSSSNSIQGYCGGNPPNASITLTRNGKVVFKDLILDEGCDATQFISDLRILNKSQEVVAVVGQKAVEVAGELRQARIPMGDAITSEKIFLAAAPRVAP